MASKMSPDPLNQITNEFRGEKLNRIASLNQLPGDQPRTNARLEPGPQRDG